MKGCTTGAESGLLSMLMKQNRPLLDIIFQWLLVKARCLTVTSKKILRQSALLMLFLLGCASTAQAAIPAAERTVLINLYNSNNGAGWLNGHANWNGAVGTECTWAGVHCDTLGNHVIGISLSLNRLIGTLPSLSGLTALQHFDVSNNQLTGSIPSLSGLTSLQVFDVGFNQLTGSIPSLSGLTALQYFIANNNQLTGSIPTFSGMTASLTFYVAHNLLSGPVPVAPPSLNPNTSNLCSNSLVPSGNPAIDATWGSWLACQTGYAPPNCTLTATPTLISAGGTSLLAGSCSPTATSYIWTGGACAGNTTSTCNVTLPVGTQIYTMRGSNIWGPGNPASTAVTVVNPILVVTKSGTGSGTITSNTGSINCGAACSASYTPGTKVTLTATPTAGSTFAGWSGDCTGTGSCVATMSAAKAVTATFKPKPFVVIPNNNITATTATVATTVVFNAPDVGKPGAVYVTGWAPFKGLSTLGISTALMNKDMRVTMSSSDPARGGEINSRQVPLETLLATTDPNAFVLVQWTSSGWQLVVNGQLIPYTSGTLAAQSAALTILNNTNTTNLLGAQICVGYGTGATSSASAADMVQNGKMQLIADVTDPNATSTSMGSCLVKLPNYSDSWWNASESGWGITIIDHDTSAFVQWYTYDQTGHNQKYVFSGTFSPDKCQLGGNISQVSGPSWTLPSFDPNLVVRRTTGTGAIDFCPDGLATGTIVFNYSNVDGVTGSKQLTRLPFGDDVPHWGGVANTGAADFTDLWWNPNESGWGVSVTQHGNNLFFRVFVYDTDGRPLLFVASGAPSSSGASFSGTVTLTAGPWFGSNPFDPNQVVRTATPGNTATLTFSDANNGVLSYTVNGVTVTKAITRLVF